MVKHLNWNEKKYNFKPNNLKSINLMINYLNKNNRAAAAESLRIDQ